MQNFCCSKCRANYGVTDGMTLKIQLAAGLVATIYKSFELKCSCGYFVKWRENKKKLK